VEAVEVMAAVDVGAALVQNTMMIRDIQVSQSKIKRVNGVALYLQRLLLPVVFL
jgi:hypothetical protein